MWWRKTSPEMSESRPFRNVYPVRFSSVRPRSGFVFLLMVLGIMLAIALLAFSFHSHRSGVGHQLAKNLTQNRLAVFAQSANNEAVCHFKRYANVKSPKDPYLVAGRFFRDCFAEAGHLPVTRSLHFRPERTRALINADVPGLGVDVSVQVTLTVNRSYNRNGKGFPAFGGFLEIVARAWDRYNTVSIKDVRDVKLVDMRDFLDQYALFVKNFSYDWNDPERKIVVMGLKNPDWSEGTFSRIYVGNRFYPEPLPGVDEQNRLPRRVYFDLAFSQESSKRMISSLLGLTTGQRADFAPIDAAAAQIGAQKAFWVLPEPIPFLQLANPPKFEQMCRVPKVKEIYREIVDGARATAGRAGTGSGYSTAVQIVEDFDRNSVGEDYSNCRIFRGIVQYFMEHWKYQYGYTDAETLIDFARLEPQSWLTTIHYSGMLEYFKTYPYARSPKGRMGVMANLFGPEGDWRPSLIEGEAYARFFKVAFFDEFEGRLTSVVSGQGQTGEIPYRVTPTPLAFSPEPGYAWGATDEGGNPRQADLGSWAGKGNLQAGELEQPLMSTVNDHLPLNRVLAREILETLRTRDQLAAFQGNRTAVHPLLTPRNGMSPEDVFPTFYYRSFSHNYVTGADFLKRRVVKTRKGLTLFLDGKMYIQKGPLDLSGIRQFAGNGLIFLLSGNCLIGNLQKEDNSDLLRIFLQKGKFVVSAKEGPVFIQASLIASAFPPPASPTDFQGEFLCRNHRVSIEGNLVVDALQTREIPPGGGLTIRHDSQLFAPSPRHHRQRISIGEVKTLSAMNAQKE
jgi:hypothetical protein